MELVVAQVSDYWLPAERAERERRAQMAALVARARHADRAAAARPTTRASFLPRIAGALGLS